MKASTKKDPEIPSGDGILIPSFTPLFISSTIRPMPLELSKLFCGIIATGEEYISLAEKALEEKFGTMEATSKIMPFTFTGYYEDEMGSNLLRRFIVFPEPFDSSKIADVKIKTNHMEDRFREPDTGSRRVNLDPGYITMAKLVLATTKNYSHRIHLKNCIYAEITLNFRKGGIESFPWTYPDFRSTDYREFFMTVRESLRSS